MDQYEYKIKRVPCGIFKGDKEVNAAFAYYGNEGWELVSANFIWWGANYDLIFKRKKKP